MDLSKIKKKLKPQKVEIDREERVKAYKATATKLKECGFLDLNPNVFQSVSLYIADLCLGERQKGLFLAGQTGVGKTLGAEMIGSYENIDKIKGSNRAKLFRSHSLVAEYQDTKSKRDFLQHFKTRETIILDDLGSEVTVSDYGMKLEVMNLVITERALAYENLGARTIVTTNLDKAELIERYGDRIFSRLCQICVFVDAQGDDLREKMKEVS